MLLPSTVGRKKHAYATSIRFSHSRPRRACDCFPDPGDDGGSRLSAKSTADQREQPAAPTASYVAELVAIDDADVTQRGSHDASYPSSYLVLSKDGQGNYDNIFVQFDLAELPANATIDSAELHLNVSVFNGAPFDVGLARVNSDWDESTITWNNQPTVTVSGGLTTTVGATGDLSWPVTSLIQAWQAGTQPNYGFMLRGFNSSGAAVIADSKEATYATSTIVPPTLIVHYTVPNPDRRAARSGRCTRQHQ